MLATRPNKISWKLLLAILPMVVLGISSIVWLQYGLTRKQILADIDKEIRNLAERTAGGIDGLLRQRRNDLSTLSESPLIADYYHNVEFQLLDEAESYRQELEHYLLNFSSRTQVYSRILYQDRNGREVCRIDRDRLRRSASPDRLPAYFTAARRLPPGSRWVSPVETLPDGTSAIYYSKPIYDDTNQFQGVLTLCYDLSQIRSILRGIKVGRTGSLWIRTRKGIVQADAGDRAPGRRLLTAEYPLKELPWTVVVEAPLADFLGPLDKIRDTEIAISLAGIAALVALILLLVRSITRPIAALAEAAERIGRGELGHRVQVAGDDELGTLSAAFNDMAENLESNRKLNAELQAQLIQSEKLSAVGQMISSVAHELSSPLTVVCGSIRLALDGGCPPELRHDLEAAHHNAMRCRKIGDNLLFFVRQSRREKSRVNLNQAAKSALDILEYRLIKTEDVAVVEEWTGDLPDILGDFQQIVQVVVNLVNNACDAMGKAAHSLDGKRLVLRTRLNGGRAHLSIQDNGPGIPAGIRERIFEPFFTTKEPGRGTGLGLSICREILQEHGGSISFSSREGEGTTFDLAIPLPPEDALRVLEQAPVAEELPPVPGRSILVVDDEKDIAELIARVLRGDGDEVEIATQGADALRLARENRYDLIISDIEMEKVKGQDILAQLASRRPVTASRMLFVTGDIFNPKVLQFLDKTKSEYMVKPFDMGELRQRVRRMLK